MKNLVTGTIITLIIGGTAYTVSQSDIIRNFANDTGLTQEQAEQYINEISEDELVSIDQLGSDLIEEGEVMLDSASEIDCSYYEYEWESASLSCDEGRTQLEKVGRDSISLGQSYKRLGSESASADDIPKTIGLIDQLNSDYQFQIISSFLDGPTIDEIIKTNSYNKAILQAVLENN